MVDKIPCIDSYQVFFSQLKDNIQNVFKMHFHLKKQIAIPQSTSKSQRHKNHIHRGF